ncbi:MULTISPECIES: DUF979 domain-containing protein [Thermoanaerobacter]|jgi:uncharacterized membrane protein|uniref:Permease n=2 Tax=Thermoanaerobacter TaxID=1754 RepID=B0K8Z6_THEP3|nr:MULTISPECIES: DUF979 domain-containing protein [Thermoanaerobacter]KUJ89986.1 MAG: hypothetical protein XD37_1800 [Thermoanaerobacter thermocopriae]ABY94609.1 protein of unknown function DUF979 [Thermoanaerobacter pseudethanolicus ATCC 33223]ADV79558.1 protein of unknown function DUF979 [Thermoanaerobacter brockii subsp. finnii Ako-1]MDI3500784.1 hypothetical protein [Thermoanaerobacter sp.]MDK2814868.1 hypothetical protein [Thermoanaerobacter sp.]
MLKDSLTEILYIMMGIVSFYSAYATLKEKNHPSKIPTALFWGLLGIIFTFSRIGLLWGNKNIYIPDIYTGYMVIVLTLLSAFRLVKIGKFDESTSEFKEQMSQKIGNLIFVPALALGIVTFIVAQVWTKQLGSLVAFWISTVVAAILALVITKGKVKEMADDGRRLLEVVGPISILPQLLAALGAVFTVAGVGEVIASGIKTIIPQGNILLGVIAYCLGMALFTMIMGNAFAAFAVITAGIGIPFVIAQGGNPVIVAALGMTAGYCGTLMTPMAANFNIVPTAILEMEDKKYGVIKYQVPVAIAMLIIHIVLMYFWAF